MKQPYRFRLLLGWCGMLLALTLGWHSASAQATLYGNEWIVPTQQYYKIKVLKDGLYRLDYQYLTQAGISGVNPQRIQLWRRGREVAIYGGGNQSTLDPTTFFEFFGQRNDGKLDQALYKGGAATQPHDLYSLYTDTAAYFLTWSATTNGRRMAQPAAAPTAAAHPHWLAQRQLLSTERFAYVDDKNFVYQSWGEAGEGFLSTPIASTHRPSPLTAEVPVDSLWRRAGSGPAPQAELLLVGSWPGSRQVQVDVYLPGTTTPRTLGTVVINNYDKVRLRYALQPTDVDASGKVRLYLHIVGTPPAARENAFRLGYVRLTYAQNRRWLAGGRQLAFRNDSTLAGPAYYTLDSIPATVAGLDVTDPYNVQRIGGTALGGQQRGYVFPAATSQTRRLLLADAALASVPRAAQRVRFRTISPAAANFIIISHRHLMRPVGAVANPVRAYADYRHSAAGGRYDTLIVTSEQLYDQFHYGEKSVGALRNFALWEVANSPAAQAKYLLLLGKGLMPGEYSRNAPAPNTDLIPVSTRSASDTYLSADWQNGDYVARMNTGRVSATTPQEVMAYLNKLRSHEALGPEPWRKNVLHMAGGENSNDFVEFEGYVDKYKQLVERPLFGGRVVNTYRRRLAGGSNLPVNITIAPEVNQGVSLVTYFGHGSSTAFDLNFGDPTDPGKGYSNANKYPVFLLNGCEANHVFRNNRTLSENWIFAENAGAVGFMSDSDLGFASTLDAFSTQFYKLAFNDPAWYGKPIAAIQNEASRRMLLQYNTPEGIAQALSSIWLGDPALRFFAPEKPDFVTSNADVQILPNGAGPLQASSPDFKVQVRVSNPGKVTYDSLDFRLTRTYPTTTTGPRAPSITTYTVRQAWKDSTYTFVLPNSGNVFGENCVQVELDYRNRVAELNEANNTGRACFNLLQGGVTTLWPPEFAVVPATNLRLVGQTNNQLGTSRAFEMELDTVPTFNSALKQSRTVTTAQIPDWQPTLPALAGRDSVVWYWRLRFQAPTADENADWATSSFRVIAGATSGWSQSHHGQFRRDQLSSVSVAAPSGRWEFAEQREPVNLVTRGGGNGSRATFNYQTDGISTSVSSYVENCFWYQANIMVAVFNGRTLKPVRNIGGGPFDSCGQGQLMFYHFASSSSDINTPARLAQFEALLNNVRPGDYVALVSMNKVNYSAFPASLKAALAALGAQRISQLQDGDPYALLAQKGPGARPVQEMTFDPTSSTPRSEQVIRLAAEMLTRVGSGTVASTRIGPAQQWQTLYHTVRKPDATDSYTLKLIGIDAQEKETVLNANVTNRALPLAGISAQQYPYLKLELELRDTVNRTAPQLKQWLVAYQGVPEGVVRRDLATSPNSYNTTVLAEQAAQTGFVTVPVVFQNVSSLPFSGPLKARIQIRSSDTSVPPREALVDVPGGALAANSQTTVNAKVNVVGLTGTLTGSVNVNPRLLPELYYFNNELVLPPFSVQDQNVPPVLDVVFDGQHILNGDIVSPSPTIVVQLKDDDRLRRIKDQSNFDMLLTYPGATTSTRINLTGANIQFSSDSTKGLARLQVPLGQDSPLENGVYTLEVQGRDATGKAAGSEPYRVSFEVIKESTITNVYPYPNPVTSKAKFVFTLTGRELPRDMKIQILTVTGRVVREIRMGELGPLRIGNNITEYAWDGTDDFGDRLANGTYLYRVILDDAQNQFTQRRTAGDQAFKKNWGKLVLLR